MTASNSIGLKLLIICLSAIMLSSCEDPFDCIVDDRPVLSTASLTQPVLNQVFESSIGVSIKNNNKDDEYDYRWQLSGQLPPGISFQVNRRELRFVGTATSLGEYPYSVSVDVSSSGYWQDDNAVKASDLCRQNVKRDFSMKVAPL